jgi:hypothetical protein
MSKTKRDKERKSKVDKFKKERKKVKRSMELPKFKPFRQVPHYEPDAKIVITGAEFDVLKSFFNVFAEPINIMQDIFGRNLNDGVITVKYIDNEGKEVPQEEVKAYMQEVKNYVDAQKAEKTEVEETQESTVEVQSEPEPEEIKPKSKLHVV